MARKKSTRRKAPKKGLNLQRVEEVLTKRTPYRDELIPGLIQSVANRDRTQRVRVKRIPPVPTPPLTVQRRLRAPQREITRQALEVSKGKPLTRGHRAKLGPALSQELRETICADRKVRREVMFAKRKTNKGSRAKTRQRTIFSDVRC